MFRYDAMDLSRRMRLAQRLWTKPSVIPTERSE